MQAEALAAASPGRGHAFMDLTGNGAPMDAVGHRAQGFGRDAAAAARQAAMHAIPYALLLALGLGAAAVVGANLANAFPSAARPFGWPGPASLDGGVATVRPELVLATSLPALLWGTRALSRLDARRHHLASLLGTLAAGVVLACAAVLAATLLAGWGVSATPADAFWGFWAAHTLLALAFYSIGAFVSVVARRHAAATGAACWVFFAVLLDDAVRWRLFRQQGYHELVAGHFPAWFYVAQALSPVSGYRAVLILWRRGFRDYTEHAALDHATLPPWMTAPNFALLVAGLWVALPLGAAILAWWLRGTVRPHGTRRIRANRSRSVQAPRVVHGQRHPPRANGAWRWRREGPAPMPREDGVAAPGPNPR